MSAQFQVDTQQIHVGASEIQRISAEIEAGVTTMMQRLTSLQEGWRGAAAAGFQQATTSWSSTQRQVRTSLDEIQAALTRAGAQYAEVEAANASLFRAG